MPKGPQGQKRPADVIGAAVMVGRIATGEIEEISSRKGSAGGKARAARLSSGERREIASKAARSRWSSPGNGQEFDMTQTAHKETGADGREAVRMYPNNGLKEQVRDFSETFSGYELLRQNFGKK